MTILTFCENFVDIGDGGDYIMVSLVSTTERFGKSRTS